MSNLIWDDAKDDKYSPDDFNIMKMNNSEFKQLLQNLNYVIINNEVTERVL